MTEVGSKSRIGQVQTDSQSHLIEIDLSKDNISEEEPISETMQRQFLE